MEESLMVDEIFPFHNFKYPTEKRRRRRERVNNKQAPIKAKLRLKKKKTMDNDSTTSTRHSIVYLHINTQLLISHLMANYRKEKKKLKPHNLHTQKS